jgi:hypothetical protein
MFNAKLNSAITHSINWNDGDILHSELQTVLHCEVSSAVAIYCFGYQKTNFISGLIGRTVIHILSSAVLNQPTLLRLTLAARLHVATGPAVCALRAAYSFAQWLNYYTLSLEYIKCPPQPGFH